jgi:hypothetical protein
LTLKVVVAGPSDEAVGLVRTLLDGENISITLATTSSARSVRRIVTPDTDAVVLFLSETDYPWDLRELLRDFTHACFVLIAASAPPRAAIARIARTYGAIIVGRSDPPVIVLASLYSLLAQRVGSP